MAMSTNHGRSLAGRSLGLRSLCALVVWCVAMTACSGGSEESSNGSEEVAVDLPPCEIEADPVFDPGSPTEVVMWHGYIAKQLSTLEAMVEDFEAENPGIRVSLEGQGDQVETLAKVQQALPRSDLPPILGMGDWNTQFMIDTGVVIPASSCIVEEAPGSDRYDDLLPAVDAAFSVEDVLWPVAFGLATEILVVNAAHLAAAGLDPEVMPGTLDEMTETAQAIKDAGITDIPIVLKTDPWKMEFWVTGARETLVNNDNGHAARATSATYDNPATADAMQWMVDMEAAGLLDPEPGDLGNINDFLALGTGSASMIITSSSAITAAVAVVEAGSTSAVDVGDADVPDVELDTGFELGVGSFPGIDEPGKGQIGGSVWYLTNVNDPLTQAAAWEFIQWFNQPEQQLEWYLEGSNLPAWTDLTSDPAVAEAAAATEDGAALALAFDALAQLDPDFTGPIIGPYDTFRDEVRDSMERVLLHGEDPAESIESANTTITELLEQYDDANF